MEKIELIKKAIERGVRYDPITGLVFGIKGKPITRVSYGYIDIAIIVDGKNRHIPAHQFAFYYYHKKLPDIIDHIDRDRSNNKIENLRETTKSKNNKNVMGKGYYLHNQTGRYCAQITQNYKHIHLGCFDTELEAQEAYTKAKLQYHDTI
jgi:hypothetical protein